MPKPSPLEISEQLKRGELAKGTAIELLISYVRSGNEEVERVESIKILNQLKVVDERFYKVFEEFMVSDSNYEISVGAAEIIIKNFFESGKGSIIWVLEHYNSPYQFAGVLRALFRMRSEFLRSFLLENMNAIVIGHIEKVQHLHKSFFNRRLKEYNRLFESKELEEFSTEHLMDILINFETVIFISVYHEQASDLGVYFRDGYVVELEMRHSPAGTERLSDIEGIFNFERLEQLYIGYTFFKDIEGINKFAKLKNLGFIYSDLKKIKYINELKHLERLDLVDCKLTKIEGLERLSGLKHLNLGSNQIEQIKGLSNLVNLECLVLDYNNIQEIKGLEGLLNLKTLNLTGNKIIEIQGLDTLINLENLDLFENEIKKINGLERLKNLKNLRLDYNEINVLENIEELEALEFLSLNANKISKVGDLESIDHPIVIFLEDNDLSGKLINDLKELTEKKKKIIFNF